MIFGRFSVIWAKADFYFHLISFSRLLSPWFLHQGASFHRPTTLQPPAVSMGFSLEESCVKTCFLEAFLWKFVDFIRCFVSFSTLEVSIHHFYKALTVRFCFNLVCKIKFMNFESYWLFQIFYTTAFLFICWLKFHKDVVLRATESVRL